MPFQDETLFLKNYCDYFFFQGLAKEEWQPGGALAGFKGAKFVHVHPLCP